MAEKFSTRKRLRKSFQKIDSIAEMPNLIDIQRLSYELFLQKNDLLYASCYIVTIKYIVANTTI